MGKGHNRKYVNEFCDEMGYSTANAHNILSMSGCTTDVPQKKSSHFQLLQIFVKVSLGTSSKNKNGKMWEFLPSWGHPHPSPQFENFFPIFPFIVGMIDWRIFVCVIMILDPWSSSICWVFKALCLCLFYGLILVWYGRVRSVLKGWHQFGY